MTIKDCDREAAVELEKVRYRGGHAALPVLAAHRELGAREGVAKERAAVAAWLRGLAVSAWGADCSGMPELDFAAFAIERGEHLGGEG